jgi:hypothetical protein
MPDHSKMRMEGLTAEQPRHRLARRNTPWQTYATGVRPRWGAGMPGVNATSITLKWIGVLLPELLRFIKGRIKGFPDYWTKPGFWLGLVFLVALRSFTTWAVGANEVKVALAYGYGVPEVLLRLISSEPEGEKEAVRGAQEFSRRACASGRARVTLADLAPMTGGRG